MRVYVNEKNEIHDVNVTSNPELIELIINDENNPFNGWSDDKICCYKVTVVDGQVTMMTPYVDSRLIENFDRGGVYHNENSEAVFDIANYVGDNSEAVFDLADLYSQLEARVKALEEKEN